MTCKFKHIISILTLFLCITVPVFSDTLDYLNASWNSVLDGELVCEPENADFGFVTVSDGRTLSAFSKKGDLLWEKRLNNSSKCIIKVLEKDFIVTVTSSGKKLSLYNSSGVLLWEKNLDFKVISKPVEGRDGRFFVYGKNTIQCFSITGLEKWSLKTDEGLSEKLQVCPVQDGSLIFFLEGKSNESTKAYRITPYGEIAEEITFAGNVTYSSYNSSGVYVSFSDGNAGLFQLEKGKEVCENKFVIGNSKNKKNQSRVITSLTEENEAVFISENGNKVSVSLFDPNDGHALKTFVISDIKFENISNCALFYNNLLISDNKKCLLYNLDGLEIRNDTLPPQNGKTKWNFTWFSKDGYLVVCRKNWALDGFRMVQTEIKEPSHLTKYDDYLEISPSDYSSPWITSFEGKLFTTERQNQIVKGSYGEKEIEFTQDIFSFTEAYIQNLLSSFSGARTDKSVFQKDVTKVDAVLCQIPHLVTIDSAALSAKVLKHDKNQVHLQTLLKGITETGWDPEGKILSELSIIVEKSDKKSETTLLELCDSVYSICAFMGRPAFNKNGKSVLSKMLYPQYGKKVNEKARENLKKIADLDM